ncbi:hypothetical protein HYV57_04210 [Candidatus Peregrinibacteria bacterium]|nr:hypothetical protein [Candidatus Peregrinibacteria bacterium]
MFSRRFRKDVAALPKHKKLLFFGSLILLVSVFFPWYSENDEYLGNQIYYGITGPLYFVGITILILSVAVFFYNLLEIQHKKVPKLPLQEWIFSLIAGVSSFYLLLLSVTVYLHPRFGINLNTKTTAFGITVGFIGAALLTVGAMVQRKMTQSGLTESEEIPEIVEESPKIPTLINISPSQRRMQQENLKRVPTIEDKELENLRMDI